MKIISVLSKGLQAMIDEAKTPQSFKTGEQFENYVREFYLLTNTTTSWIRHMILNK